MDVQGKHVLVVGLARSGLAVARALVRRGAVVTVSDNKPPSEFRDILPELLKDKVGLELGAQRVETFLKNQIIVTSPGVPWDLPQLKASREKNIPIYPEVEVASWFLQGPLVGITGSNGKTTTTSLLGDMLKASGFPTFVGGNIGNALSSAVDTATPGTKFVTELSSFQLEGIHSFRPHVAVMLNLSPNHLDRHPSLEAYAEAKRQIFRNQGGQDYAVLNADDPWVAGLQSTLASRPVLFSRTRELPSGVFASGGKIYYRVRHLERVLFETRDVALKGDFNLEDVLAATTAACLLGADFAAIRKAVREFKAVEHRLEFVREIRGVDFYNNSKATSVDATLKSLGAFERGVHLILGGKDKGAPYTPLVPLIKERVRDVLLIGAAAPVIAPQLAGSAELLPAGDLETAVYEAFARARPGDTVLLAPACSSFDQFHDYEERGRVFKDLVKQLANDFAAGRTWRPKLTPLPGSKTVLAETAVVKPSPKRADVPTVAPVESAPAQVESPVAVVETRVAPPPAPTVEKSAAERRLAARKRAREMASEQGWRVSEPPPAKIAPAEPPAPPMVSELPSSPVPALAEQVEAAADTPVPDDVAPIGRILALDPVPVPTSVPTAEPAAETVQEPPAETVQVKTDTMGTAEAVPTAPDTVPAPVAETVAIDVTEPEEKPGESATQRRVSSRTGERKTGSAFAPGGKGSAPSASHRVELNYVYEVGAVELPGMDSQVVPDDEPTILISATTEDGLDDEVMPFESRPAKGKSELQKTQPEVRGPKSEGKPGMQRKRSDVRSTMSEARPEVQEGGPVDQPAIKQPKLFDGSDK